MGNENSIIHDHVSVLEHLPDSRQKSAEPVSPHFQGAERSNVASTSPLPNRRKASNSPGLDSLASELKRGKKKLSSKDIKKINNTIKFVEVLHAIKQEKGTSIHLNEGPFLGLDCESISRSQPLGQDVMADRMSFSANQNDLFLNRCNRRVNAYFEAMDKTKSELHVFSNNTLGFSKRRTASWNKGFIKKQNSHSPSFQFNPLTHKTYSPYPNSISSNCTGGNYQVQNMDPELFKNMMNEALQQKSKKNYRHVSQGNILIESTLAVENQASRIKRGAGKIGSLQIKKNVELDDISNMTPTLPDHSHLPVSPSEREITIVKEPKNALFGIADNVETIMVTETNSNIKLNTEMSALQAKKGVSDYSEYDLSRVPKTEISVLNADINDLDTKKDISVTEISIDTSLANKPKGQIKKTASKQQQQQQPKGSITSRIKKNLTSETADTKSNQSHIRTPGSLASARTAAKITQVKSDTVQPVVKRADIFSFKSSLPEPTPTKTPQIKSNKPANKTAVNAKNKQETVKKNLSIATHPSSMDENISPNVGFDVRESVDSLQVNFEMPDAALDLSKYVLSSATKENNSIRMTAMKEKEVCKAAKPEIQGPVKINNVEGKVRKESTSTRGKLNTRTNSLWGHSRTQSSLGSIVNIHGVLNLNEKIMQAEKPNAATQGKWNDRIIRIFDEEREEKEEKEEREVKEEKEEREENKEEDFTGEDMNESNIVNEIKAKLEKLTAIVDTAAEKFKIPMVREDNSLLSAPVETPEQVFANNSIGPMLYDDDRSPERNGRTCEKDESMFSPNLRRFNDREILNRTTEVYGNRFGDEESDVAASRDDFRITPAKALVTKKYHINFES